MFKNNHNPFEIKAVRSLLGSRKEETEMARLLGDEHKVLKFARIFTDIEEDLRVLYEVLKVRAVENEESFVNLKYYKKGLHDFFSIFHKSFLEAETIRRKKEEEDTRKKKKEDEEKVRAKRRSRGLFS